MTSPPKVTLLSAAVGKQSLKLIGMKRLGGSSRQLDTLRVERSFARLERSFGVAQGIRVLGGAEQASPTQSLSDE